MNPPPQKPQIIANRVRMKLNTPGGAACLLVEGDDDKILYRRFVAARRCRIQTAYGRPNVEKVLRILATEEWQCRVLGIVDADFDALEGREAGLPNLFRTDAHDAETMMLRSPALDHVLREHGHDGDDCAEFPDSAAVREALLQRAGFFGALRWIAAGKKLSLRFENFRFERVVRKKTWALQREEVIPELQGHSQVGIVDEDALLRDAEEVLASDPDPWQLCCGHDLIAILSIGLQGKLGQRRPAEVKVEFLVKDLRLAYETAYFAATALCRSLQGWDRKCSVILCDELRAQETT